VLGTCQPVAKDGKKTVLTNIGRRVEVSREGTDRFLVHLKEEAILTSEVLENRSLGYAERAGDVPDPRGVVTLFGKMPHSGIHNAGTLVF
jgi:hypothetical protein